MNVDTAHTVEDIVRIHRRTDAEQVALGAYTPLLALLEQLTPAHWQRPTECPAWDVAAMVGHLIGAARSNASVRELVRQQRWGRRHAARFDGNSLDAVNALQVDEHAGLSPAERIATLRELAPAAVRGRMRTPAALRRMPVPLDPSGSTASGMPRRFPLGLLLDVVYTRDVWLHTVDIARATGVAHRPTEHLDGRIVADVVAEWANRHGQPFTLELTGPAGGRFQHAAGGPQARVDAIELCRVLSGRAEPKDLANLGASGDVAGLARLCTTRVVF